MTTPTKKIQRKLTPLYLRKKSEKNEKKKSRNFRENEDKSSFKTPEKRSISCRESYNKPQPRMSAQNPRSLINSPKPQITLKIGKTSEYIKSIDKQLKFLSEFLNTKNELIQISEIHKIPENIYYMSNMLKSLVFGEKKLKPFLNHFMQNLKSFRFLENKKIPPIENLKELQIELPPLEKKKTLILDLDETLIHCQHQEHVENEDLKIKVEFEIENQGKIKVKK